MARVTKQQIIDALHQEVTFLRAELETYKEDLRVTRAECRAFNDQLRFVKSRFDELMNAHLGSVKTANKLAQHINEVRRREQFNNGASRVRQFVRAYDKAATPQEGNGDNS